MKIGWHGMLFPETAADVAAILDMTEGSLQYLLNNMSMHHYGKTFPSRSGKIRSGSVATNALRSCHERIKEWLYSFSPHKAAHGWQPGRSTVTCAFPHVKRGVVLKFDIQNFFPSISSGRVQTTLEHLGCGKQAAAVITKLTTVYGYLPQGFSTSPALANLIFIKVDARIENFCEKFNYRYTRFGDDLTISARAKSQQHIERMIRLIITTSRFHINEEKFAERGVQEAHERQQVLGINVNSKLSVPAYRREHCERMIAKYNRLLLTATSEDKEDLDLLRAKIRGWISYIRQISPAQAKLLAAQMPH